MKILSRLKRAVSHGNRDDSSRSHTSEHPNQDQQQQQPSSQSLGSGEQNTEVVEEVDVDISGKIEVSQRHLDTSNDDGGSHNEKAESQHSLNKEEESDHDQHHQNHVHQHEHEEKSHHLLEDTKTDEDKNDNDEDNTDSDLENLDDMLADIDIDRDFQMFSSFRNSMTRRSSVQQLKTAESSDGDSSSLKGNHLLASITEATPEDKKMETEDIEKWRERYLEREEVFSHRYHPSKDEKKELRELENLLGMRSITGFFAGNTHPDQDVWNRLFHPETKKKAPESIILKRAPLLYKSSYDTEHTEHEIEFILLTHGMVIAKVVDASTHSHIYESSQNKEGLVVRKFERALEWKSVICINPNDDENIAFELVIRGPKGQERLSFISGSQNQQKAWLEALEITTVNCFMHDSKCPKDLGWQYRINHKPGFTMAVTGIEDEYLIPGGTINDLDEYNGYAPLHYAVRLNHESIAESLLEENADPNLKDKDGLTPAVHAVNDEAPESLLRLLERFGARGIDKAKDDKEDLFERVTATNEERAERKEVEQQKQAMAAQAQMAENMRLLQERGQKIDEAADKARELNENAAEYGSLAAQLKEKTRKQASWNPFS